MRPWLWQSSYVIDQPGWRLFLPTLLMAFLLGFLFRGLYSNQVVGLAIRQWVIPNLRPEWDLEFDEARIIPSNLAGLPGLTLEITGLKAQYQPLQWKFHVDVLRARLGVWGLISRRLLLDEIWIQNARVQVQSLAQDVRRSELSQKELSPQKNDVPQSGSNPSLRPFQVKDVNPVKRVRMRRVWFQGPEGFDPIEWERAEVDLTHHRLRALWRVPFQETLFLGQMNLQWHVWPQGLGAKLVLFDAQGSQIHGEGVFDRSSRSEFRLSWQGLRPGIRSHLIRWAQWFLGLGWIGIDFQSGRNFLRSEAVLEALGSPEKWSFIFREKWLSHNQLWGSQVLTATCHQGCKWESGQILTHSINVNFNVPACFSSIPWGLVQFVKRAQELEIYWDDQGCRMTGRHKSGLAWRVEKNQNIYWSGWMEHQNGTLPCTGIWEPDWGGWKLQSWRCYRNHSDRWIPWNPPCLGFEHQSWALADSCGSDGFPVKGLSDGLGSQLIHYHSKKIK